MHKFWVVAVGCALSVGMGMAEEYIDTRPEPIIARLFSATNRFQLKDHFWVTSRVKINDIPVTISFSHNIPRKITIPTWSNADKSFNEIRMHPGDWSAG